jgi:hypothetical protein
MIPDDTFDALCCGARMAVQDAWEAARAQAKPAEMDHVFQLVRVGTRSLVDNWGPILQPRGVALRVTGVFCHQTPFAHFKMPGRRRVARPELADLLIVHQHTQQMPGTGMPTWTRRAVLLQAKMTDDGVCRKRDPVQEFLYRHWPLLELKGYDPSGLSFLSGPRDLKPNDDGGRYALIARTGHLHSAGPGFARLPYCCGFPWWFAHPAEPARTAGAEDAGAFIANMLFSTRIPRGRPAVPITGPLALAATPNNHFDVTIEELLQKTAARTLASKNGLRTGTRGEFGVVCFQADAGSSLLSGGLGTSFHPSSPRDGRGEPSALEDDGGGGISVLLIETGSEFESV